MISPSKSARPANGLKSGSARNSLIERKPAAIGRLRAFTASVASSWARATGPARLGQDRVAGRHSRSCDSNVEIDRRPQIEIAARSSRAA